MDECRKYTFRHVIQIRDTLWMIFGLTALFSKATQFILKESVRSLVRTQFNVTLLALSRCSFALFIYLVIQVILLQLNNTFSRPAKRFEVRRLVPEIFATVTVFWIPFFVLRTALGVLLVGSLISIVWIVIKAVYFYFFEEGPELESETNVMYSPHKKTRSGHVFGVVQDMGHMVSSRRITRTSSAHSSGDGPVGRR